MLKKVSLDSVEVVISILEVEKIRDEKDRFQFNDILKANVHLLDLIAARDRFSKLVNSACSERNKKLYLWWTHFLNMRITEVNNNISYLQNKKENYIRNRLNVGQVESKEV